MLLICFLLQTATTLLISNLSASISNSLSNSTFTIDFQSSIEVRSECTVVVEFPPAYNLTQVPLLNSTLTLLNNSVALTLSQLLKSVTYTMTVHGVKTENVVSSSSGLFKIFTYKGTSMLQQNHTAGSMGISPPYSSLVNPIVYLDPDSIPFAGEIAYYNFVFSLLELPLYSTRIEIVMPNQFQLPVAPSCSLFSTDGSFKDIITVCYSRQNTVIINNFTVFNKRIALKISLLNPNRTGTTDPFSILVYKQHTSNVISMSMSMAGVTIQHGRMYSLSLQPHNSYAVIAKSKVQDYLLGFTPRNSLSNNNRIDIELPPYAILIRNTLYDYVRIIDGLNGTLSWNETTIWIDNAIVYGRVQIVFRMMNPPFAGQTNPFVISTYDNGVLVDHSQQLTLDVLDIETTPLTIQSSFSLNVQPINNLTNGTIVISNILVNSPVCRMNSVMVPCRTLNGQIILQYYNLSRLLYNITLQNINYYPGVYLIDVFLYDGTRKQSSSVVININSNNFLYSSISAIDCEVSQPPNFNRSSILNITIVTDYDATYRFKLTFNPILNGTLTVKPILGIIPKTVLSTVWQNGILYISDFMPIRNNTRVELHIAGVDNPTTASPIRVSVANELETTLRLITLNYCQQDVLYSVMPTKLYGYTAVQFNISDSGVGKQHSLTFQPMINGDLSSVHLLVELPGYYTMFMAGNNKISCQINNVFYECVAYSLTDWILILDVESLMIASAPTVTLFGLKWPLYADSVGYVRWRAIDRLTLTETDRKTLGNIIGNTTYPAPTVAKFTNVSLSVSDTSLNAPGVTFSFRFTTSCLLPSNTSLAIHFPVQYTLNVSSVVSMLSEATISGNIITFNELDAIPAMTMIEVYVMGVKMPDAALPDGGFNIYATMGNKPIQSAVNFGEIQYSAAFQPDLIDIIVSVLSIVSIRTDLLLSMEPYHSIPESGTIRVHFPSELHFDGCHLVGAITQFTSCQATNNILTVVLAQAYYTGRINLTISSWLTPATAGNHVLTVQSYYDDSLLDSNTVSVAVYSALSTITGSISSDPSNEGEFGLFTLTVNTTVLADTLIIIPEYTRQQDSYQINHIGQHTIHFTNVNPPDTTFLVMATHNGVVQQQGIIQLETADTAGWMELIQYSLNDSHVGRPALLQLQLHIPSSTPTSLLDIYLPYFDCSLATVSGYPTITASQNRILVPVTVTGILTLDVSLLNPNRSGDYTMDVRMLDNTTILSKIYHNLDRLIISIVDVGPQLTVNDNEPIIVYENTVSDTIYIAVEYPSRYVFTIQPVSILSISTIVFPLYGRRVGFTIAVAVPPGTYTIKWNIVHPDYSAFYNPIVETTVEVRHCSIMNIHVQTVNMIPNGGNSLPLAITIPFVAIIPVQLTLSVNGSFRVSPEQIIFSHSVQYFTIQSLSEALFQGSVLSISSNHTNYTMDNWQYDVVSLPTDNSIPFISQLNVIQVSRSYIVVSIGTSQLSVVQLVVLPWYDSQPTIVDGVLQKVNAIFTAVVNLTYSVQQQVRITNLSSDGHYVVYCLATDRSNTLSSIRSQELVTMEHRKAVEILYPIGQPNMTAYERDQILIPLLAFYLSCPVSYLLNPYSKELLTSELANLYANQVFYQPIWMVMPDQYQVSEVLKELENSKQYVSKTLTHISLRTAVTAQQVSWTVPSVTHLSLSLAGQQITVNTTLSDYGTVYVAVSKRILNYTYQVREMANCTGILYGSLDYSCTVESDSLTDYMVYATAGDIGPIYTSLGTAYLVQKITTEPSQPIYHLNVNGASRHIICLLLCLIHLKSI